MTCELADRHFKIPLVIHPSLDMAMESLQMALCELLKNSYNKDTLLEAFIQATDAIAVVSDSLFVQPDSEDRKARALYK